MIELIEAQAGSVSKFGNQLLEWYLTQAEHNPALARLTQFVAEKGAQIKPGFSQEFNEKEFVGWIMNGAAVGFVLGIGLNILEMITKKDRAKTNWKMVPLFTAGLAVLSGVLDAVDQARR